MDSKIVSKMKEVTEGCMGDAPAYCQSACPLHTDIKGYVNKIAEGKYEEALEIIRQKIIFPASVGRICAHPCEDKCKRGEMKNPMSIAALKRFVADNYDDENKWDISKTNEGTGKKIAIIGAGPAGAQAAYELAKKNYDVTIFERLPVLGGMMRVGIPEYRLPRDIIDLEYKLLDKLDVKIKLNTEIGKDIKYEDLKKEFDAVLVAIGAHEGIIVPVEGAKSEGVFHAVEFLKEVSLTRNFKKLGKKVLVVGGGNVALDCVRSSVRLDTDEVHLICLEPDIDSMPAHNWEVEEALEEGVKVHYGYGTKRIISDSGKVTGIEIVKCISMFDESGNFNPKYDDKQMIKLDIDSVIFAIGQGVDNSVAPDINAGRGGRFNVDKITLQSKEDEKVFVAGDCTGDAVIVIEAMAEGKKAAKSIDLYLRNQDMYKDRDYERAYETWLETEIDENEENLPRIETQKLDPKNRITGWNEVDLGLVEEEAKKEAERCFECECLKCVKECEMLSEFSECPKDLFQEIMDNNNKVDPIIPYSCNMCKQCTLACPKDYEMQDIFMDMRKEFVEANNGKSPMKGHKAIDMHQKLGFSKMFNTTVPAANGNTKRVFIPGCSLPSYKPELVGQIFAHLQEKLPGTGAILKCCGKPTKALGQVNAFKERYSELQAEIDKLGAEEIIVACQSCYLTMREYSPNQKVTSLWELMPKIGLPEESIGKAKSSDAVFAIHDSCSTRDKNEIHDGVRWIMEQVGYKSEEPIHTKENTMCCGFGGMVVPANPEIAQKVMKKRTSEVNSNQIVTYCAACRESMIQGGKNSVHLLDLVFDNVYMNDSQFPGPVTNPLTSWLNRYKAKKALQNSQKKFVK